MTNDDDGVWFAPKRYGYGTGLPIVWQGWALLGGYMLFMGLVAGGSGHHPLLTILLLLPATVAFATVARRRTRRGWRWRSGE